MDTRPRRCRRCTERADGGDERSSDSLLGKRTKPIKGDQPLKGILKRPQGRSASAQKKVSFSLAQGIDKDGNGSTGHSQSRASQ